MRLLIWIILLYLGYRFLRSWTQKYLASGQRASNGRRNEEIADIMIKDPYCNIYFPRNEGVPLTFQGEELYFCSSECRDKYLAQQSREGG